MNEYFQKIAEKLPGFEVRDGQLKMFQNVLDAYSQNQTFLIEAGTGIGKSLAYLIPAMLWALEKKEPTVIATHTIALQEQLMQKDIPFLLSALDMNLKAALVKGMNNYLCLRKLYDSAQDVPETVFAWVKKTQEGSRSELPIIPTPDLWDQIGAEADNCTHVKCPHYKECFYFKARKNAADAHLIVANHHLLFADLAIREENDNFEQTAVMPAYKHLIIDEAHHCEEVATQYFAEKVSRRGLIHHLGRLISDRGTGKLAVLYRKICEAYPEGNLLSEPLSLFLPSEKRRVVELVQETFEALSLYFAAHKQEDKLRIGDVHLNDPHWINQVQPQVGELVQSGREFVNSILLLEGKLKQLNDPLLDSKCEGTFAEITGICSRLQGFFDVLHAFVFTPLNVDKVRWVEGVAPDLHLISADLEVASRLKAALFQRLSTIILCSATLATNGNFHFIRKRLGIEKAEESIYGSPFNYQEKVQFCVPMDLPDPAHPTFTSLASDKIWDIIEISRGGAFVLFTSYSMLKSCEKLLSDKLYKNHYLLYCQGDESRSSLLRKFRSTEKAVLFGTDSFWEGVDVAGEALRCVIIVKLPFKVPNDPLFQARSEAIASQGGSPFFDYSLPHAIVKFKQGFGRLIRNKEDRGCVVCLDPRLIKKGYGKKFLQSLPDCPVISDTSANCLEKLKVFYYNK